MKTLIALFATAALLSFKTVAPATWTSDPAHSKLGFTVTHMMVSDVEGTFKNFTATIASSKDDFSDATIDMSADIASISTDNDQRDTHLKSPDFFDAAKFPKMTFKSTSVQKTGDKTYKVNGNLTLRGVTKPVSFDATLRGTYVNQAQKQVAGFKVSGVIKRTDFGVGTKFGNAMVSEDVTLIANAELVKN